MEYTEIEVRFLEIDKEKLIAQLHLLGAQDHGEHMLEDVVMYDEALTWRDKGGTSLRLRTYNGKTFLTYKHRRELSATGTDEIEFEVSSAAAAEEFLSRIGYVAYRHQQKRRRSFLIDDVMVDIDDWPRIPTYVELEGPSEEALKAVAERLNLDWAHVEFRTPRMVIEEVYKIPLGTLRWFTFDRLE